MARQRSFDRDEALDAAIEVFSQHGYEGTSSEMLLAAMGIGRQSLYGTFVSKWGLYLEAVKRYTAGQVSVQIRALGSVSDPVSAIRDLLHGFVRSSSNSERPSCLGVSAVCEFGRAAPELSAILDTASEALRHAVEEHLRAAQASGAIVSGFDPKSGAAFIHSSLVGLKVAARGGADAETLNKIIGMILRSLGVVLVE